MIKSLPDAVKDFIAAARVCRVATVRPSGAPHLIPVCPAFDGDSTLYVDIAARGVSAAGVRANSLVTVLIDEYDDDWSKLKAVILRCHAEEATGGELDRAWDLFRRIYPLGEAIGWSARFTLALRIRSWTEWGIAGPLPYQPE